MDSGLSSSSKVTIEYSDPSGLFPLISSHLQRRLPLRNLHWTSTSRPLRSISSLHVELVPDNRPVSRGTSVPPPSRDATNANLNGAKERRHQIPGLRQTPYLKIYLLQCRDTETYKAASRTRLRDWVREHTPPSQSTSQVNKADNHDAFEWLIVHIVVLNEDLVTGSRRSGSPKSEDHPEKASGGSRWSTRGSSTLIEKIRSDFNATSKTAADRVVQILIDGDVEVPARADQRGSEDKYGFNDLTSKLKSLILASFDQRVSQYEEDIREKDSQRNLPGWNFNTFFLLKEGLARGFESVGLVEDALTNYHELSASLTAITMGDLTRTLSEGGTNRFGDFTDDLMNSLKRAMDVVASSSNQDPSSDITDTPKEDNGNSLHRLGAAVLDTNRKPYRELILANNISAFDFLCYVFARQISLLLRLANAAPAKEASSTDGASDPAYPTANIHPQPSNPMSKLDQPEANLLILADMCRQSVNFVIFLSRVIRNDFYNALKHLTQTRQGRMMTSDHIIKGVIENLVASWTFSACECILETTSVPSLLAPLQGLLRHFKEDNSVSDYDLDGSLVSGRIADRDHLPRRTSSLQSPSIITSRSLSPKKLPTVTLLDSVRLLPPRSSQTGLQAFATQRANLSNLARGILGNLGMRYAGWCLLDRLEFSENEMHDVPLDSTSPDAPADPRRYHEELYSPTRTGVESPFLELALSSESSFYDSYEELTASILGLFVLGDKPKSAEAMAADIGMIRCHVGDYAAAASYFAQLAHLYARDSWTQLELNMLNMYAHCLKQIGQVEEYVRIGLKIIAKVTLQNRTTSKDSAALNRKAASLADLIAASTAITTQLMVPMQDFFGHINVNSHVRPYKDHDGFYVQFQLHNLTPDIIKAQATQIKLIAMDKDHPSELWLAADEVTLIQPGILVIQVGTKIMRPGWYALDQVLIRSENIVFTYDPVATNVNTFFAEPGNRVSPLNGEVDLTRVLVWPQVHALDIRLTHHHEIHLEKTRSILAEISSGWNDISQGKLLLRAGSAGLRIHTGNAALFRGDSTLLDQSQTGSICFGRILANSAIVIEIPYALESDLKYITIKVEVFYTTEHGNFTYAYNPRIPILLPLGVSVQDIFQNDALFSRFTISTVNAVPVRVTKCHLQSSVDFEVSSPSLTDHVLDVFARQPLSLISRIHRRSPSHAKNRDGQLKLQKLMLEVEYRCLDREIVTSIERCLIDSLKAAQLQRFSRLLVPWLLKDLCSQLTVQELELSGLVREVSVLPILISNWNLISSGIPPGHRKEIANWLTNWGKEHATVEIENSVGTINLHYLYIPVDIPYIDVIHTVSLQLHGDTLKAPAEVQHVALGQAIPAQLVIQHNRKWSDPSSTPGDVVEFCFEVHANPETWLIGGHRKAYFSAREHQTVTFPLLLLPQRTGHLLYPSVDITFSGRHDGSNETKAQGTRGPPSHTSEVDYRNQGDSVLVLSDRGSTTVGINLEDTIV